MDGTLLDYCWHNVDLWLVQCWIIVGTTLACGWRHVGLSLVQRWLIKAGEHTVCFGWRNVGSWLAQYCFMVSCFRWANVNPTGKVTLAQPYMLLSGL